MLFRSPWSHVSWTRSSGLCTDQEKDDQVRGGGEGRNPPDLPLGAGGGGSEGRGGAESLQVLGGYGEQGGGQWPLTAASL